MSILIILFFFIFISVTYLGPLIFVIFDKKTSGREKIGWILLFFILGIVALPFYLIKTNKSN